VGRAVETVGQVGMHARSAAVVEDDSFGTRFLVRNALQAVVKLLTGNVGREWIESILALTVGIRGLCGFWEKSQRTR